MKSDALQYLESRLAIGHINIQEFSALHDLLALFNRLVKLVKRTYAGDIDFQTGSKLITEEAAEARKHLHAFQCLYSHTARECENATDPAYTFDLSNPHDEIKVSILRREFKNDMERLPGTKELFDRISAHFDDNIYHPFLESHRRNPDHRIWELESELTAVYIAMTELYCLVSTAAQSADRMAQKVAAYQRACDERDEGLALKQSNEIAAISRHSASSSIIREQVPTHPYKPGRSFSAVEEAVNRRPIVGRARYTAQGTEEAIFVPPQSAPVARRIEHAVPRVFTGSFSELEESVRRLQMPETEASPTTNGTMRDPNVTMESVTTPVSCATPNSGSNTSPRLRRREALIEHEVEFQDRIINGENFRSRRPVECELAGAARTQAKDDSVFNDEKLTRWFSEPPENERRISPSRVSKDSTI